MTEKFHQRFNIEVGIDEAKRRFTNRAHNLISVIMKWASDEHHRASDVEKFVCTKLGERWTGWGCLPTILGDSFNEHVRVLEALYEFPLTREMAESSIKTVLKEAEVDIGIR